MLKGDAYTELNALYGNDGQPIEQPAEHEVRLSEIITKLGEPGLVRYIDQVNKTTYATAAQYATARAALVDDDGRPIYRDDQHAAREIEAAGQAETAATAALEKIDDAIQRRTAEIESIEAAQSRPLLDRLADRELDQANRYAQFVREDCQSQDGKTLVAEVESAVKRNDRPMMFLYARYLPARIEATPETDAASGKITGPFLTPEHRKALRAALDDARAALDPGDDGQSQERIKAIQDEVRALYGARRNAYDVQQRAVTTAKRFTHGEKLVSF